MATDTNKKSASGEIVTNPDGYSDASVTPQVNSSKRRLLFALLLFVMAIVLGALFFKASHKESGLYAEVGPHKIYKKDVENLIGDTKNVSLHQGATVLADKYLSESMAKQQGISVTDQDIETAYGSVIKDQKDRNKYAYQYQVNQLYFDKLQAYNTGIYKGWVLVTQFSRNIALEPPTQADKETRPEKDNRAAIEKDKKYARDLITNLYNQIKSGKLTFEQAAAIERNDPVLGVSMYPVLSHSSRFDTSQGMISLFKPIAVRKELSKLKPGQTSKPFVVRVSNAIDANYVETFESYFLVVHIDSASGGNIGQTFEQELLNAKKQLGYKVHV